MQQQYYHLWNFVSEHFDLECTDDRLWGNFVGFIFVCDFLVFQYMVEFKHWQTPFPEKLGF